VAVLVKTLGVQSTFRRCNTRGVTVTCQSLEVNDLLFDTPTKLRGIYPNTHIYSVMRETLERRVENNPP